MRHLRLLRFSFDFRFLVSVVTSKRERGCSDGVGAFWCQAPTLSSSPISGSPIRWTRSPPSLWTWSISSVSSFSTVQSKRGSRVRVRFKSLLITLPLVVRETWRWTTLWRLRECRRKSSRSIPSAAGHITAYAFCLLAGRQGSALPSAFVGTLTQRRRFHTWPTPESIRRHSSRFANKNLSPHSVSLLHLKVVFLTIFE